MPVPWLCLFRSFLIVSVTVSDEDVAKAGKAIKEVEEKLLPQCTRRFKANFLIGKADYFIRRATRPGGDIREQERDLETGADIHVYTLIKRNVRRLEVCGNTPWLTRYMLLFHTREMSLMQFVSKLHFPVILLKIHFMRGKFTIEYDP